MPYLDDSITGLQTAYPDWRVPTTIKKAPGITGFSPEELASMGTMPALPKGGGGGEQDPELALSILAQAAPSLGLGANPQAQGQVQFQDPLASQKAEVDATEAAQRAAINAGFTGAMPKEVGGGGSETDVNPIRKFVGMAPSPTQQMGQAARAAESAKIQAPVEEAKIKSAGDLAVEQARTGGAMDIQRLHEDALKNFFNSPNRPPGLTEYNAGTGAMRFATPAQMFPPLHPATGKEAENLAAEKLKNEQAITSLQTSPLSILFQQGAHKLGGQDIATRIAQLKARNQEIDDTLVGKPTRGSGLPPAPAAPAPAPSPSRLTRPLKNGGTAYSDDGGKTWYQD